MIQNNTLGLRTISLKAFSELINHCRTTPVVTEQIKKTRLGLTRISLNYVEGLSKLYTTPSFNAKGEIIYISAEERAQIIKTL